MNKIIYLLILACLIILPVNAGTIIIESYNPINDILYLSWDYADAVDINTDTGIILENYPSNNFLIYDYSDNPISVFWVNDVTDPNLYNAQITINPQDYSPELNLNNYFTNEIIIIHIIMFGCVLIGYLMYYFYLPAWLISVYLFYYVSQHTSDYRLILISLLLVCAIIMTAAWKIKTLGDE